MRQIEGTRQGKTWGGGPILQSEVGGGLRPGSSGRPHALPASGLRPLLLPPSQAPCCFHPHSQTPAWPGMHLLAEGTESTPLLPRYPTTLLCLYKVLCTYLCMFGGTSLSQDSEGCVMAEAATRSLQPGAGTQKVLQQNLLFSVSFCNACGLDAGSSLSRRGGRL